jgi:hypothetical protein
MKTVNELLVHLAKLKKLTHLGGFLRTSYLEITTQRCSPIMKIFATTIPSLVYLQVSHHSDSKWAYIERDGEGTYLGYTYLNPKPSKEVDPEKWGGFYFGE